MDIYERYIGQVFDNRYRIDALIGVGGMAVVYKAVDLLMRRIVAVKILRDDISTDDASVKRFINESKAVAMLSHPNIVNIYDVSVRDNVKYIVMEYIEGITLKNYMTRREVLSFKETLGYSMQILRALDHAHKKGIVHRDIKPQNIMLLRDGVIKVMDFGIAKLPNAETVTMSDKAIGTVYYISPEQASGEALDSRSDLYSLGVLMYEMSTGRLPFEADSPVSVALKQVNDDAAPPRSINPKIPQGLEQIIMKAMEKDPSIRYQNAEQMLECLEKLRENPSIVFKPKASEKFKSFFQKRLPLGRVSKSMLPIVIGVFSAFFIAFSICAVYIFTHSFSNSSIEDYESVDVENFVGATYTEELERWFQSSKYFRLAGVEYRFDENTEKGRIIGQSPAAGESKRVLAGKQFCEVTLIISNGEENFELEDYISRDYRLVVSELRNLQIKSNVTRTDSMVYPAGTVIGSNPPAGTMISAGDTIELFVSRGAGDADLEMPDFEGKHEAETFISMAENKLRIGKVTYEKSEKAAGTVIGQSIEAGEPVYYYTVIDFVVSGGPKYGEPEETTTEEVTTDPEESSTPEETVEPEESSSEETPADPEESSSEDAPADPEESSSEETPADPEESSSEETPTDPEESSSEETPTDPEESSSEEAPTDPIEDPDAPVEA